MQFLKKHYEKIILCLVLLGLGAAVVWMGSAMHQIQGEEALLLAPHAKPLAPLDLTPDMQALARVTNPPPFTLSGEHNLFNPVTWRRKPNGELLKIMKTGPDALSVSNIVPLYTIIGYDHASGGGVYVLTVQQHSGRKSHDYSKVDEKKKSSPYIIRGVKGPADDPVELVLEIPATQETVSITKTNSYKYVDGYTVEMRYDPEARALSKMKLNDSFTLDSEPYKIVEITNNLIRVQSIDSTKVTTIRWNATP
jgi:hypothetical protein